MDSEIWWMTGLLVFIILTAAAIVIVDTVVNGGCS
jgi:hypothetical protein